MKKILSFTLALLLIVSLAVTTVFAEAPVDDLGMHITIGDFETELVGNNEVVITNYHGFAQELTIPAELDGYQIVGIAPHAFEKNLNLEYVNIASGISTIGERAFALCKSLSYVTLPNTITTVDTEAFLYCTDLLNISIPDSLTSIGDRSFGYNRRTLDLETLTYSYQIDPTFGIDGSATSLAKKYAEENNCRYNSYVDRDDDIFEFVFEVPSEWTEYSKIYCHISEVGNDTRTYHSWQSDATICANGKTKDILCSLKSIDGIEYGTVYEVVFSTDTGYLTHPAVLTANNNYDILSTNHTYVYTPDNQTPRLVATWQENDMSDYEDALGYWDDATFGEATPEEVTPDEATRDEATPDALPWGDANCDGKVNIKDSTAIQKHLVELATLSDKGLILSRFMLKDKPITIRHATEIQKYCASMRTVDLIGKPAVTRVLVERPSYWYHKDMKAISWSNTEDIQTIADTSGNMDKTQYAVFNIPIYNSNIAITCDGYTTEAMTADFFGGDRDGINEYVGEYFDNGDSENIRFIWATHA